MIFPMFLKAGLILIQNNMYCNGLRQRKALNTAFMIILEICQSDPFDIIAMTLAIYTMAIYTLTFALKLFYKPLGILQRVT